MASKEQTPSGRLVRLLAWGLPFGLLVVPLVAGFPWTAFDYLFAGALFATVGGTFELAVRSGSNGWYRAGTAVALGTGLLLVWINGAVGIIGNEDNPSNLLFLAVIGTAVAGALAAKFRASGLARAMSAAAAAQVIVALLVLIYPLSADEPPETGLVVILILFFSLTWLLSAWLFFKAARRSSAQ